MLLLNFGRCSWGNFYGILGYVMVFIWLVYVRVDGFWVMEVDDVKFN